MKSKRLSVKESYNLKLEQNGSIDSKNNYRTGRTLKYPPVLNSSNLPKLKIAPNLFQRPIATINPTKRTTRRILSKPHVNKTFVMPSLSLVPTPYFH